MGLKRVGGVEAELTALPVPVVHLLLHHPAVAVVHRVLHLRNPLLGHGVHSVRPLLRRLLLVVLEGRGLDGVVECLQQSPLKREAGVTEVVDELARSHLLGRHLSNGNGRTGMKDTHIAVQVGVEQQQGAGEGVDGVGALEQRRVAHVVALGEEGQDAGPVRGLAGQADVVQEVAQRRVDAEPGKVEVAHELVHDLGGDVVPRPKLTSQHATHASTK